MTLPKDPLRAVHDRGSPVRRGPDTGSWRTLVPMNVTLSIEPNPAPKPLSSSAHF
jgi:hypothetical protein